MASKVTEMITPSAMLVADPAVVAREHNSTMTWAYLPMFDCLEQASIGSILRVLKYAGMLLVIGLLLAYLTHVRGMRKLDLPAKLSWLGGFCLLLVGGFMAIPREGKFVFAIVAVAMISTLSIGWGFAFIWAPRTGRNGEETAETVALTRRPDGEDEASHDDQKLRSPV